MSHTRAARLGRTSIGLMSAGLAWLALGALGLPPAPAQTVNVADPVLNPLVRVVGTTTHGPLTYTNNLNDGLDENTVPGCFWQTPTQSALPGGSRGFGYDFGGPVTINSLGLSQFVGDPGPRARLADVVVHTAAGDFPFSLPDRDDHTLTLPAPVTTPWLVVETLRQHPGKDTQIGIDELAVFSNAGAVAPGRVNVARGRAVTLRPPPPAGEWNEVRGDLTDGLLAGASQDRSTALFNREPKAPGVSIDIDLGQSRTVDGLGLAEHDYSDDGGRWLIQNMRLQFSDDPAFGTVNATRNLVLENIVYQQVNFDAAMGRYARLTFQSQYTNRHQNVGFTEVQLFQPQAPPFLAADANGDGRVDVSDLGILATNYNESPPDPPGKAGGDFNGDGVVNVADLGILATHYGQPRAAGTPFEQALASFPNLPAIPEPAALALSSAGALGLLARRRRRAEV